MFPAVWYYYYKVEHTLRHTNNRDTWNSNSSPRYVLVGHERELCPATLHTPHSLGLLALGGSMGAEPREGEGRVPVGSEEV